MSRFPFGWIRDFEGDNWQILWDSETGSIVLKGASGKTEKAVSIADKWTEAKSIAEQIQQNPEDFIKNSEKKTA